MSRLARFAPGKPGARLPRRSRILAQARHDLFAYGYSAFTMGDLARAVGMSKKTLYAHFAGKDALIRAVLDQLASDIRREAEAVLVDETLTFAEKLRGVAAALTARLNEVRPAVLRDLQRFAPELHQHIEELRSRNIPAIFGRLIAAGQAAGAVRGDLGAAFAGEFYLQALQAMLQPSSLQRLRLTPEQVLNRTLRIFFGGLLTAAGHKDHDKTFAR